MIKIFCKKKLKYLIIVIFFLSSLSFLKAEEINWSENYFPFSAEILAGGNTYTNDLSANYISPGLNDDSTVYFSTSFLQSNTQVYYIAYKYSNLSFDLFYYDWNKIDYRDDYGNDLGYYYSSNYSFSTSYTRAYKSFKGGLQIRYNLKEIGRIIKDKLIFAPYLSYENEHFSAGGVIKNLKLDSYLLYGGVQYNFIKAKTRLDYFNNEYKLNYGFDFYLNDADNYVLFLGVADKKYTAGFGIKSRNIKFNYGFMLENEQIFVNNFGIRLKL